MSSMRVKIVQNLSRWFSKNARSLPWRNQPEPYYVWLSEIMLQQTQVVTVTPYFERFLQAFPTIEDLAQAQTDDVLKLWAGLGYYSRARNLHRGAKAIAERIQKGEGFPKNREEWLAVPGVGEYTAGAVCSIALNQREAIVDGNVVRVLSRLNAIEKLDLKKTAIWSEAKALVESKLADPRVLNQAMMELGALICKPRNPKCEICPVQSECLGKKNPERYPEAKAKTVWKRLNEDKHFFIRVNEGKTEIYLEQNSNKGWRQGLWDFPDFRVERGMGREGDSFESRYTVTTHKITRQHRVIDLSGEKKLAHLNQGKWFSVEDLPAVPSPVRKAIQRYVSLQD